MAGAASTPQGREPLYQQIARHYRNQIQAGVLRHGEVLPSTNDLAAEWGTSDFTVSEAMKLLISEDIVRPKSRSRRVVHSPATTRSSRPHVEKPQLVLIGGYAGSGKTELGRILARLTGWPMLDKDTITRPVVEAALEVMGLSPNDRESPTYLEKIRPREYESLMTAAVENVECGNSVIATAPFVSEFSDSAWITRTVAQFDAINATVNLVWIYCDPETMHTYVRRRGAARDAAKLADWPSWIASIDTEMRPPVPHHVLDNSASSPPLQAQAQALIAGIVSEGQE